MTKKRLGIIITAAVVLAALLFAVERLRSSKFAWNEFTAALTQADRRWLGLSMVLALATYVGRALRWEVMIRPLRADGSIWRIFSGTVIGFTAVVLFGRAGEPVRPYLIAKSEGLSFSSQIAAWLLERILDLLMILLVFGIALTQISRSAIQPGPRIAVALQAGGYTAGLAGVGCLALLVAMRQFRGRLRERLLGALSFLPQTAVSRIGEYLVSFEDGMQCMRSTSSAVVLFAYSILEWCVIAGSFACVFKAFPATARLGLTDVVILLGFVAFGSALQIPGVGGGMQIATVLVLTEFFGIGVEAATGIALVLWIISFVLIVPVGLALAFSGGIKLRNLRHLEPSEPIEAPNPGGNL